MLRKIWLLAFTVPALMGAGDDTDQFHALVDPQLKPRQESLTPTNPLRVAASRDASGVQTDFLESIVLIRPKSEANLREFLARYGGVILRSNAIPAAAATALGVTLTPAQRRATAYRVRVNLDRANAMTLAANAARAGLHGRFAFSSDAGLRTFAISLDALAAGYTVSGDFMEYPQETLPEVLTSTSERSAYSRLTSRGSEPAPILPKPTSYWPGNSSPRTVLAPA